MNRLTEALLDTAADMNESGIMSDADYEKTTRRHHGKKLLKNVKPVSGDEIRSIRERNPLQVIGHSYSVANDLGRSSAYSRPASCRTGRSLSAFFQNAKNCSYAARLSRILPCMRSARASPR